MIIIISFIMTLLSVASGADTHPKTLAKGQQPQISRDTKGILRVVYGEKEQIFCATSYNNGNTFTKPVLVGQVSEMHLGMTRGPQIASSNHFSIITAIDKSGNIHSFRLSHRSNRWESIQPVNDLKGSGPEGLMSISADERDNFYAVWLDMRKKKSNQIFFSALKGGSTRWSENKLLYESPSGHVCECCKPSISTSGLEVSVMFRNWLWGSRDLYYVTSKNEGRTFSEAVKLGTGTWKLNACPMDGGGLWIDGRQKIHTAWQRQGDVYYSKSGQQEKKIGSGRNVSMVQKAQYPIVLFQTEGKVTMATVGRGELTIGNGGFAKGVTSADNKILLVWENEGLVLFKKIG